MPFLLGWHFLFDPINPHFFHHKGHQAHEELLLTIPEIDKNIKQTLEISLCTSYVWW